MTTFEGLLKLTICDAKDLKSEDYGKKDPYCKVSLGSSGFRRFLEGETLGKERFQTRTFQQGGINPVWNESHAFNLNNMKLDSYLKIALYDNHAFKEDFLGLTRINLDELLRNHYPTTGQKRYYELLDQNSQEVGQVGIMAIFDCTQIPQMDSETYGENQTRLEPDNKYVPPVFDRLENPRMGKEHREELRRRKARTNLDEQTGSDWGRYTVQPGIIRDSASDTSSTPLLEKASEALGGKPAHEKQEHLTSGGTVRQNVGTQLDQNYVSKPAESVLHQTKEKVKDLYVKSVPEALGGQSEDAIPQAPPLESSTTTTTTTTVTSLLDKAKNVYEKSAPEALGGKPTHEGGGAVSQDVGTQLDQNFVYSKPGGTGSVLQKAKDLYQQTAPEALGGQSEGTIPEAPPMTSETTSTTDASLLGKAKEIIASSVSKEKFTGGVDPSLGTQLDQNFVYSRSGGTGSVLQKAKDFYVKSAPEALGGQTQGIPPAPPMTSETKVDSSVGTQLDQNYVYNQTQPSLLQKATEFAQKLSGYSEDVPPAPPLTSDLPTEAPTSTSLLQKAKELLSSAVPAVVPAVFGGKSDKIDSSVGTQLDQNFVYENRPAETGFFQKVKDTAKDLYARSTSGGTDDTIPPAPPLTETTSTTEVIPPAPPLTETASTSETTTTSTGASFLQKAKEIVSHVPVLGKVMNAGTEVTSSTGGSVDSSLGTQLDQNYVYRDQTSTSETASTSETTTTSTGASLFQKAKEIVSNVPILGKVMHGTEASLSTGSSVDSSEDLVDSSEDSVDSSLGTQLDVYKDQTSQQPSLLQKAKEFVVNLPSVLTKTKEDTPDNEMDLHPSKQINIENVNVIKVVNVGNVGNVGNVENFT